MVGVGRLTSPSPSSALPPPDCLEAAPKYISGRTSYLRVRLAFHLYPQLIPAFCTRHGFGPSPGYYPGFSLAMGSSPGFGSNPNNTSSLVETRPLVSDQDHPRVRARPDKSGFARKRRATRSSTNSFDSARFAPYSDSLSLRLRNCYSLT